MAVNQQMSRQQHPYYASSLEGLTGVLREQGQYEAAEPLQRQALEIRRATLGTQHPEYAQSQLELAALFQAQGKTQDAEPLYRQALQALKPTTSGPRLRYAEGLINLGTLLGDQGKLREADALGEQALDVVQRAVGKNHPLYAACLRQLAKTRIAQGQAAVENLRQAVEISEALLGDTVSESRVRALVELLRGEEDLVYSQLLTKPQHGPTLSLATALTLLRKGRSEDAGMRARAAVRRATGFAQFDDQFSQWENFRREHEKLILMGSQGRPSAQYFEQLDELSRQAEQLEYSLVSENDRLRANKPPPLDRIVAEVAQRLPPDGALLELVFVQPSQLSTAASADATAPHYLGILLFPDQRLASFDLGTAQTVEKAVVSLRKDTQNSASDPLEAAQALYQMLLGPAQEKLVNVRKLFVSADGALSFVPFAALHDGHDYLIARYEFHYLTSGRDLLRPSSTTPPGPALLLGNPRFRPPTGPGPMEIAALPKTPAPDAVPGLYDLVQDLPPIPNTRVEVESLARLIQVHPFTGDSAAEARLRTARGPHVLHIASHGVFLDDLTAAGPGGSRVGIRVKLAPTEPASSAPAALFPQIKNPLSRSALVLAPGGGLTFGERFHDGLLTADEVRGLDLRGTRLVVLSACDSGRGALSTGQGVYGLRRSFLIAGAETLVVSLWSVADDATRELMINYYKKLVSEQRPRVGAMVEAMSELRQRFPHPYYWAPFIVIGMDGPIGTVTRKQ